MIVMLENELIMNEGATARPLHDKQNEDNVTLTNGHVDSLSRNI